MTAQAQDLIAEAPAAIETQHLGWRAGSRWILRDVTLKVPGGTLVGLAGPNGSGKSALLRLLATLAAPSEGSAALAGFDTVKQPALVRRNIGYLPERAGLYDRMTIFQNLDFIGRVHGLRGLARPEIIRTLLDVVGLTDQAGTLVEDLSPGLRRRAALAGALVHDPPVLLLDDPLRGMDGLARLEQVEVLRELRGMGKTVLLASNLLADLAGLSDELVVLRQGRVAWRGVPEELPTSASGDDTLSPTGAYDQALVDLLESTASGRSN